MVRGDLPAQTPQVPHELFFVIDDLYRYLQGVHLDMVALETGASGTFLTADGKTVTVVNGRITLIV